MRSAPGPSFESWIVQGLSAIRQHAHVLLLPPPAEVRADSLQVSQQGLKSGVSWVAYVCGSKGGRIVLAELYPFL
jgi:hypothetical protein